jgi:hypothetical protein
MNYPIDLLVSERYYKAMLNVLSRKNQSTFKVIKLFLPLATIFVTVIVSVSVFTIDDNNDELYPRRLQYLSSQSQNDGPNCDDGNSNWQCLQVEMKTSNLT